MNQYNFSHLEKTCVCESLDVLGKIDILHIVNELLFDVTKWGLQFLKCFERCYILDDQDLSPVHPLCILYVSGKQVRAGRLQERCAFSTSKKAKARSMTIALSSVLPCQALVQNRDRSRNVHFASRVSSYLREIPYRVRKRFSLTGEAVPSEAASAF
jgi:hypothetical protein